MVNKIRMCSFKSLAFLFIFNEGAGVVHIVRKGNSA